LQFPCVAAESERLANEIYDHHHEALAAASDQHSAVGVHTAIDAENVGAYGPNSPPSISLVSKFSFEALWTRK